MTEVLASLVQLIPQFVRAAETQGYVRLAWNDDSTRLPAAMHSRYLRSCYLHNEFARGEFTVDGVRLEPASVAQDTYVVGAVDDHIVPWTSSYRTTQLVSGEVRFVLQNGSDQPHDFAVVDLGDPVSHSLSPQEK